jgi:trigger factor
MSNATETSTDLEIGIADTAPCTKEIRITMPADAVGARIDLAMGEFLRGAALPGFRPGKAPRALVEKRFGQAIVDETRGQVIQEGYRRALEEHKIRPLGDPRPVGGDELPEFTRGKAFTLAFEVEVAPSFDLPDFASFEVKRPMIEVTPEHIDAEILRQSYRWGAPERIEGPFEHLDRMLGKATVTVEGRDGVFFETDKALCVVPAKEDEGKGAMLGLLVEGLDNALLGKKVGDTVSIATKGADSHEREELRGKAIAIEYAVAEAERITPRTTKELAEMFGVETEELFREQMKDALEQRRDGEQRAAMREQVSEALVSGIDFELPSKLTEDQLVRTIEQQRMELLSRGLDADAVERRMAEMRGKSEQTTRNRVKLFFIMSRLAEEFGVNITEQEVNGRIAMMAAQQGVRPEQMRQQIVQSGRADQVIATIRDAKVADRIIAQAKVEDMPADEWNKIVEAKAKA